MKINGNVPRRKHTPFKKYKEIIAVHTTRVIRAERRILNVNRLVNIETTKEFKLLTCVLIYFCI